MTRAFTSPLFTLLLSFAALAQPPAVPSVSARFEAASIKPVLSWPSPNAAAGERGRGGGCPTSMKIDPQRLDFQCTNLAMLIGYAFRISPDRVAGPEWTTGVGSPRFNIVAAIPCEASRNQVPEMLQALLAERFKLVTHRAAATLPVYALVVAKSGLRIKKAPPQSDAGSPPADADAEIGRAHV